MDNNSPVPAYAFVVLEVLCVLLVGAMVLALAGGGR
jgi:hypothetical protein